MITVSRYEPQCQKRWDQFVQTARNSHFIFERGYLEYHADRFTDASLLFEKDGKLVAVLPAHRIVNPDGGAPVLVSHEGLSFAGLIVGTSMNQHLMDAIFAALIEHLRSQDFEKLRYRPTPTIYDNCGGEEDLWHLQRKGATVVDCKVAAVLQIRQTPDTSETFRRMVRRALRAEITISRWDDVEAFHSMLSEWLLDRHQSRPVHTVEELQFLWNRFPKNMFIQAARKDGKFVAANLIFNTRNCLRLQYSANTSEGIKFAADHLLIQTLLTEQPQGKRVDFGTSMTSVGELQGSLHAFKESCGARTLLVKTYELLLS